MFVAKCAMSSGCGSVTSQRLGALPFSSCGTSIGRNCFRVRASGQGFGEDNISSTKTPANVKLSKRGTPASRGGGLSRKDLKRQSDMYDTLKDEADDEDDFVPEYQEVPQVVSDRMLKRIITFCGIPVFSGFVLLPGFYYLKVGLGLDVPIAVVYTVQSGVFGLGLLGITYGIMSTSFDPRREGSFLGVDEFKANLPLLIQRLRGRA